MLTDTRIAAIKPPENGQKEHPDHKVTGLRLRVGAGGKKTWTLRKRVGAKVINRKLGSYPSMKLAQARNAAEQLIVALEQSGSTEALDRTFETVARYWIQKVAKQKNRSWQDQERALEKHVFPKWADRKIIDIKRGDVRELIMGIEGVVLPNRVLALLKTILGYAVEQDWLDASPADRIKMPKAEKARDRVLTMPEIKRVWNAASLMGYPAGSFVQMLLLSAQRRAEVASMRWADIDLQNATWTITADDAKSGKASLVPLPPLACEMLENMPEIGPFVFSTDGRTHLKSFSKTKSKLDSYIAAKSEPMDSWRLHDLRRSAATHMVRLGINETTVGRILNHAQAGVTAKHYALHSYAPEKRRALEAWAAEVDRAVNGEKGDKVVSLNG